MEPLISIIIPAYNRGLLIGETLDSVYCQTYSNWECIVVDDGSIDNTEEIVNSYSEKDIRFKFYNRPQASKNGASACRNYGLEKSKGELIQFLDSDDLLAKNKLEEQVKFYKPQEFSLITCKWGGFEESSNLSKRFKYKYNSYKNYRNGKDLLNTFGCFNEYFPPLVYLTPKILIERSGLWNQELTNNDDAEFFTRVILNTSKIIFSPEASVYYRYKSIDKLSELNNEEKVISAITSWKLIESHIKEKDPYNSNKYIRNGKFSLYNAIINNFPLLVAKEQVFFNDRKNYSTSFNRIIKDFWLIHFFKIIAIKFLSIY